MLYQQQIESCFTEIAGEAGIARKDYESVLGRVKTVLAEIKGRNLPLFTLPLSKDGLDEITETAKKIKKDFTHLVLLGTGGSTLNPQSLVALAKNHNIYFIDNVDPDGIESVFNKIDLKNTAFLVTSKSGRTVETLSQFFVFHAALEEAKLKAGRHFFIITDPKDNPLREIGEKIGAMILDHEPDIGGRFSTFTNVGLLPAAFAGLDIAAFRRGAAAVINSVFSGAESEPAKGAALSYSFMQKGININVMMPYIDRLSDFTIWCRQIWAESLGKDGKGGTFVKAKGALDQHSQLQLYLDGPRDKFFTLITTDTTGTGRKIKSDLIEDKSLSYINGKTIGDINAALQQSTADTLVKNGCPLRHMKIDSLNEEILGALLMHFTFETVIMAGLMGVNAFDQPAVEEGKLLAREILSA